MNQTASNGTEIRVKLVLHHYGLRSVANQTSISLKHSVQSVRLLSESDQILIHWLEWDSNQSQISFRPIKVLDQFEIRLNLRSDANQAEFRLGSKRSQIRCLSQNRFSA